ncbi:LLM class flavin-dependent oxidoreductase [Glutamicibacter nicotianae]|uniref:LLM class flavin-dependent oxidoreductase n=1 Tax=Glutamicibacter nicotianae TaxID=37929 RepID=UPI001EF78ADA|nr:LLM class flavin-dependent oxidoreductase [Glutamicibacter nicotianae]MBM7767140.1 luciferase family oxidoreductase group 1 [Glutamicibacter nicotianae]
MALQPAPRFGSAPFALSVHTGGGPGVGQTAQQGLNDTIGIAKAADQHGYHRFWMSEHHAMPALSVASPLLMMARLTADTQRIRLGAGGVMLPNHAPLVVAEQIGMLEALAPGRIDLGVGRGPGTDGATAAALRRGTGANETFDEQLAELVGFLNDDFPAGHPYSEVHAVPGPWQNEQNRLPAPETQTPLWILGSSPYSAQLAARLGRPYAFALQFGDADIDTALRIYRENFVPSAVLDRPYVLVSQSAIAAEDPEFARAEASTAAMAMLRMFKREPYALLSAQEVAEYPATLNERAILDMYTNRTLAGTPSQVAQRLEALQQRTGADELMMVTGSHTPGAAVQTVQLMARHYQPAE